MSDELSVMEIPAASNTVVVRACGILSARSTPSLLVRCRALKESRKSIVLNLSGISFIASSGIGGLLVMIEEFRDAGLSIRFAALSTAVESVVKLLNLDGFMAIDADENASVAAADLPK